MTKEEFELAGKALSEALNETENPEQFREKFMSVIRDKNGMSVLIFAAVNFIGRFEEFSNLVQENWDDEIEELLKGIRENVVDTMPEETFEAFDKLFLINE